MNIELNPDVERMVNYFVSAGNANAQVVGQRKRLGLGPATAESFVNQILFSVLRFGNTSEPVLVWPGFWATDDSVPESPAATNEMKIIIDLNRGK